jgi:filamentous hemagglutinin
MYLKFQNFDEFRQAFWKEVANDPVLSKQFDYDPKNIYRMKNGYAPRADIDQQVGGRKSYELDHNQEIQNSGNVYDMNNIIIRTPYNHIEKTKGNY